MIGSQILTTKEVHTTTTSAKKSFLGSFLTKTNLPASSRSSHQCAHFTHKRKSFPKELENAQRKRGSWDAKNLHPKMLLQDCCLLESITASRLFYFSFDSTTMIYKEPTTYTYQNKTSTTTGTTRCLLIQILHMGTELFSHV